MAERTGYGNDYPSSEVSLCTVYLVCAWRKPARRLLRHAAPGGERGNSGRFGENRAHRRDLCREPQLRQHVRHVPRRQRRGQRDGRAEDAARPRRKTARAPAPRVHARRQARSALSAECGPPRSAAQRAAPHRPAARRRAYRPGSAEPDPQLLPEHRADQRRQEQPVRRHDHGRRVDHGLLRWIEPEAVAMGARVHAGRQFLHGRLRRLVPESHVAGVRVHAGGQDRARFGAGPARPAGKVEEETRLAEVGARRAGATARRPRLARRLRGQHLAAAVSAERHSARRGRQSRSRRRLQASRAAADGKNHRRHPFRERRFVGLVCRRVEAGARRWAAGSGGQARRDLCARPGKPDVSAASSAAQLLRALRAGHRRPREISQGWRGVF